MTAFIRDLLPNGLTLLPLPGGSYCIRGVDHNPAQAYAKLKTLVGDWPQSPQTQPASQPATESPRGW
jgi:hypothetical protein